MVKTLSLMVGNIGTGKTTTVRRLLNELGPERVQTLVVDIDLLVKMLGNGNYCPDTFTERHWLLYEKLLYSLTQDILIHDFNAIIDTTMMSKKKRAAFIEIAKANNAIVKVYLHNTPGGLERRCADNRGQSIETWKFVFDIFAEEYEEPSLGEGIEEIIDCTWAIPNRSLKNLD